MHFDRERVVQRMRKWEAYLNEHALPTWDKLPGLELYMDQVTSFIDGQLAGSKRNEDDKLLTKTMINNYTKNDLLPPPVKKKYSKEHLLSLIFIYSYEYNITFFSFNNFNIIE